MKTFSGKVLSSKPISLKKATSILSTFASTDNGPPPAICAYLRRALASFKELRHQEKELGVRRSEQKNRRPKSEIVREVEAVRENPTRSVEVSQAPSHKQKRHRLDRNSSGHPIEMDAKPPRSVVSGRETCHGVGDNVGEESKRQKHRKNKQKGEFSNFGANGEAGESGGAGSRVKTEAEEDPRRIVEPGRETGQEDDCNVGMESERKKHKKKKKDGDYIENVENDGIEVGNREGEGRIETEEKGKVRRKNIIEVIKEEMKVGLADLESAEPQSNKKKKTKKKKIDGGNFEDNGTETEDTYATGNMVIEEVKEENKKMKSVEVEEKGVNGSEEQRGKKKKRKTD